MFYNLCRCIPILAIIYSSLSCSKSGGDTEISTRYHAYDPSFMGDIDSSKRGIPLPPKNMTITPDYATLTLSWETSRLYFSPNINIGFVIFRRLNIADSTKKWDFTDSRRFGEDWQKELKRVSLKEVCKTDGKCSWTDELGGRKYAEYAMMAIWDVKDKNSSYSTHVSIAGVSYDKDYTPTFEKFTEKQPIIIGTAVGDPYRNPSEFIYNFTSARLPWYLIKASEYSSDIDPSRRYLSGVTALMGKDSKSMILPDFDFNRSMIFTRLPDISCEVLDHASKDYCESLSYEVPPSFQGVIGQKRKDTALSFNDNALDTSRKFKTRSASHFKGESGTEYFFVADEARILVRVGEGIKNCEYELGEASSDSIEGKCGFSISIGTTSPRQRCLFKVGGATLLGHETCTDADLAYSLSDSTAPNKHSLRNPSAPVLKGKNLYIPDSGNARIVMIYDFEEKIKSCGKLRPIGEEPHVDAKACEFNMIIGQYVDDYDDQERFNVRGCVRGGERGGKTGNVDAAETSPFLDPLSKNQSGGDACRMDIYEEGGGVYRKNRLAGDYRDASLSMISPDSALLAEKTKRMFRAPIAIDYDHSGKLYVLDYGYTIAQNASGGESMATLPPRIMIWNRDPFTIEQCIPTDPLAATPSCHIDQNSKCQGEGCEPKQCETAECNATYFVGQPSELFGILHSDTISYEAMEGYTPIAGMAASKREDIKGLWVVTGVNRELYHYPEITQGMRPTIYNKRMSDPSKDFYDGYKVGIFGGVSIDEGGKMIIGWDTKASVGYAWTAERKYKD